jgi:hypothetical protein
MRLLGNLRSSHLSIGEAKKFLTNKRYKGTKAIVIINIVILFIGNSIVSLLGGYNCAYNLSA